MHSDLIQAERFLLLQILTLIKGSLVLGQTGYRKYETLKSTAFLSLELREFKGIIVLEKPTDLR